VSYGLADEICLGLSRGQGNEIHIKTVRPQAAGGSLECRGLDVWSLSGSSVH